MTAHNLIDAIVITDIGHWSRTWLRIMQDLHAVTCKVSRHKSREEHLFESVKDLLQRYVKAKIGRNSRKDPISVVYGLGLRIVSCVPFRLFSTRNNTDAFDEHRSSMN